MGLVRLKAVLVVAVLVALVPSTAEASIIIGQSPPLIGSSSAACFVGSESYQGSVSSGPDYVVPAPGVITKWRTFGNPNDGGDILALRTYSGNTALAESAPESLSAGILNQFDTRIPVAAGDRIGTSVVAAGDSTDTCGYSMTGSASDFLRFRQPTRPVGVSTPAMTVDSQFRLDLSVVIEADADGDGFGDETQDACPTVAGANGGCAPPDTTGPVAAISSGPKAKGRRTSATFKFSSDDPSANYECSIDNGPFAGCASPTVYRKLKHRKHVFAVRGIDAAKNVGAAATYEWTIKRKPHKKKHH